MLYTPRSLKCTWFYFQGENVTIFLKNFFFFLKWMPVHLKDLGIYNIFVSLFKHILKNFMYIFNWSATYLWRVVNIYVCNSDSITMIFSVTYNIFDSVAFWKKWFFIGVTEKKIIMYAAPAKEWPVHWNNPPNHRLQFVLVEFRYANVKDRNRKAFLTKVNKAHVLFNFIRFYLKFPLPNFW